MFLVSRDDDRNTHLDTTTNRSQEKVNTPDIWGDVIGIAKDGHMTIGPYKQSKEAFGRERFNNVWISCVTKKSFTADFLECKRKYFP